MVRAIHMADRLLDVLDQGLRSVAAEAAGQRPSPATTADEDTITPAERAESIRLLRVNRAGEIAAQALYKTQALFARDPATAAHLEQAAAEEIDHLDWCTQRLRELGGAPSRLDPFWYGGSAAIGLAAGLAGDAVSLGFVAETENQVEAHIEDHLQRLPASDRKSRAILEQMREDEARHGNEAMAAGGTELPGPIRELMKIGGETLRRIAYRL